MSLRIKRYITNLHEFICTYFIGYLLKVKKIILLAFLYNFIQQSFVKKKQFISINDIPIIIGKFLKKPKELLFQLYICKIYASLILTMNFLYDG